MLQIIKNRRTTKTTEVYKKMKTYATLENSVEFYISENTASYRNNGKKTFTIYYDNPEHSVRLLKGDCIAILNHARENSVDMIFADPPYFLSNGGITCHAGKMVSVNKGKWDKSRGVEENHKFTLEWLKACQRVLKPNGTTLGLWNNTHNLFSWLCHAGTWSGIGMRQHEAVINVMEEHGGYATLGFLNQEVLKVKDCVWKTKTPFASIRRIVQDERFFFKIKPGLWALKSYKEKLPTDILPTKEISKSQKEEFNHTSYQGFFVKMGNLKKFQTFVPNQDKNRLYLGKKLSDIT